ncbi:hypothetical protein [Aquimarina sp. 2201CG14-23]|uniref:hypothetical protein n=1 Tax=Aquimarina mycalae TaxID=3040073 RepID=UPI0024780B92|nr:hypothetical protein [Aquimarina sp. 2201CG14-23]MDH7445948.1 hypothetical protein [Aquimarina sp. 2201CG14-23]
MFKIKYLHTSLLLLFISSYAIAQEELLHQKINQDMYSNFSEAFSTLDYSLFASIHSEEMIRISGGNGGEIKDVKKYLEGYKKRWNDPKRKASPIDFRLFERITSDSLVSDRGIYRVTYQNDKNETQYSYGQFHVLLRNEKNTWKILIDYDSNEQNTINKQSYDAAFSLLDYKKYWKHKN